VDISSGIYEARRGDGKRAEVLGSRMGGLTAPLVALASPAAPPHPARPSMKILSAEFETSATGLTSCPRWNLPEFAFIGRSNVGKSSLINLLTERKSLAIAAATPGKTKLLNFFRINRNWALVDLPGYGYAQVATQDKHEFNRAVADYLEKRPNLVTVFLLLDSRHEPQRLDLDFLRWLVSCDTDYALIFTKTDKQSAAKTSATIAAFLAAAADFLSEPAPPVFTCSSIAREGRDEILAHLKLRLTPA
jgi:GTP-binding protein